MKTTPIRWCRDLRERKNTVALILAATFLSIGFITIALAPAFLQPAEDATILFRYSDNFAQTGIISYNLNGLRTEGATDFLWMILLSGARLLGLAPYAVTGIINVLAIIATVLLLFRIANQALRPDVVMAAVIAFLISPQILAGVAGFGVLPFGAMIVATAYFYLARNDAALAVSALILCLLRPDGLVFALPMLGFRLLQSANWPRQAMVYGLGFLAPLVLYFAWRWSYFGEMFPLPFLVKSNVVRWHGIVVIDSALTILLYFVLSAPIIWLACGKQAFERSNLSLMTALIFVPSAFYAEMSLAQNIADRFFYYIIVGVAIIVACNSQHLSASPRKLVRAIAISLIVLLPFKWLPTAMALARGSVSNITQILFDMRKSGLSGRMAVTEAGRLPYYTGWQAVDLWGLNTADFAHHLVQPDQIQKLETDLVEVYSSEANFDCSVNPKWQVPYAERSWPNLVANVIVGLSFGHYQLFIVPEESSVGHSLHLRPHNFVKGEGDYYCYFVSAQYSQRDKLIEILRRHGAMSATELEVLRHPSYTKTPGG